MFVTFSLQGFIDKLHNYLNFIFLNMFICLRVQNIIFMLLYNVIN